MGLQKIQNSDKFRDIHATDVCLCGFVGWNKLKMWTNLKKIRHLAHKNNNIPCRLFVCLCVGTGSRSRMKSNVLPGGGSAAQQHTPLTQTHTTQHNNNKNRLSCDAQPPNPKKKRNSRGQREGRAGDGARQREMRGGEGGLPSHRREPKSEIKYH